MAADAATAYDAPAGRSISAEEFEYVRGLVHAHAAIALESGKEYLVESRLGALARLEGFGSVPALIARLRHSRADDLHRRAVEAMTNNETLFFRDPRPFAMLEHAILPALLARLGPTRTLHAWCAACSTGQEPYSLAMLLAERLPPLVGWNVSLKATDLSRTALARARAGRYTQFEVDRGVPVALRKKYFERHGAEWSITATLRRMVTFEELNLAHPWPALPRMDLIVMRNVLIYLDPTARKQIVARVARQLAPGGYLMLGGSETLTGLDGSFETVSYGGAACFRAGGPG